MPTLAIVVLVVLDTVHVLLHHRFALPYTPTQPNKRTRMEPMKERVSNNDPVGNYCGEEGSLTVMVERKRPSLWRRNLKVGERGWAAERHCCDLSAIRLDPGSDGGGRADGRAADTVLPKAECAERGGRKMVG